MICLEFLLGMWPPMLNQCGIYDLNPGLGVTFLDSGELITRT